MANPSDLKIFYPGDLDRVGTIEKVLETKNTSTLVCDAEEIECKKAEIYSESRDALRPTEPVLLPLAKDGLFPSRTISRPVFLSHLEGAVCCPGGLIQWGDRLFSESFRNGVERGNTNIIPANMESMRELSKSSGYIEEPVIYLDGEHFGKAFGHFFGEIYSRLWLSNRLNIRDFKILVGQGHDLPYIKELLSFAGIRNDQLVELGRPIRCRTLYVASPSHVVRTGLSSVGADFYSRIAERHGNGIDIERIYISRRLQKARALTNEKEVENVFRRNGFDVLIPEILTIRSQLSLFYNARYIAGLSGSNLFGCLVSKEPKAKYMLTGSSYILHNDFVFNTRKDCHMNYYIGKSPSVFAEWQASLDKLKVDVKKWIDEVVEGQAE